MNKTRSMCLTAMFAVMMVFGAWLNIPTMPPFTMQTFVLYAMLWLLTAGQMTGAVLIYIALGLIGLPVFSGFQGGFGVLLGPSGGYLIGFALMALMRYIPLFRRHPILTAVVGSLVVYAVSCVWYMWVYADGNGIGFLASVVACVLPYIVPDILKAVAAGLVCRRISVRF